jgi:hypothetical protein
MTEDRLDPAALAGRLHSGPVQQMTAAKLFVEAALMELRAEGGTGLGEDGMLSRGVASLTAAIESSRAIMGELLEAADRDP